MSDTSGSESDSYEEFNEELEAKARSGSKKSKDPRFQLSESDSGSDGESVHDDEADTRFQMDSDGEEADGVDGEEQDIGTDSEGSDGEEDNDIALGPSLAESKPLSQEQLEKFKSKIEKSGVCYMSRIPPFMKHTKLRSMLTPYGSIGRIYLNPEDAKITARRKKYKNNKRQNYVEGWIEFADKKVARQVAAHLNNTNFGGKKRSYYYDDIWNIKYLPRFKWNHLTEQLAYELKVKEQKMKTELAQAKRENKMYIKNVERAKMIEAMEEKKAKKRPAGNAGDAGAQDKDVRRRFKQRKVQETAMPEAPKKKSKIASKLFS